MRRLVHKAVIKNGPKCLKLIGAKKPSKKLFLAVNHGFV